jgi:hypothetical protein
MICPGSDVDCDNPGCRHGGCQGRPPQRLRGVAAAAIGAIAAQGIESDDRAMPAGRSDPASQDCLGVLAMTACPPWTTSRRAPTAIS